MKITQGIKIEENKVTATISVSELLTLIENINYYLEDDKHKKSTSF